MVRDRLADSPFAAEPRARVVLSGGASQLTGIPELAPQILGHFLVRGAFQIEPEGVRLELGKARAEGEDEALELLRRDDADDRVVDADLHVLVHERVVHVVDEQLKILRATTGAPDPRATP